MQGYFFRKGLILGVVMLFIGAGIMPNMVKEVKADIAEGLVAYWSFDEGSGNIAHDYFGNNNDGVIDGPRWVPGISGYSLKFDGINDYVSVPDDPSLNFHNTNKFSISLWIKREEPLITHYEALISKGTGAYKKGYNLFISTTNTLAFRIRGGGREYVCFSNTEFYDNIWYHVVTIWDGQTQWIYINGILDNTQNLTNFTIDDDHKPLEIGNHYHTANHHPFHGLIDEVRIYNRVLSEGEIRFLYNHPGGGSPPAADFEVCRTGNPRIIKFNATGLNLTGALLKWDLNGDGKWDKMGDFDDVKTVLYEYSASGIYTATLYVENPAGNSSYTKKFAVLTHYDVNWSNHDFFLSYPTTPLTPPLKNKYVFICPTGVLDHVVFKLGERNYTDDNPGTGDGNDVWEAVINMNEGEHGKKVQIFGYDNEGDLVWEDEVDTFILITPPWFNVFLLLSDITVYNSDDYSYWNISIVPPNIGLGYKIDNVPVKYIGGRYGVNATVTGPQNFTIESTETLTVYYPLCSLDIPLWSKENKTRRPVDLGNYKKARWHVNVDFAATADVQINPEEVALAGCLTLQGEAGVSFDVPVAGIPFLAEAGLTGGVDAEFGTRFVVARFGDNGLTFCPEGFSKVFFGVEGHAGLYAQVLWGLGRLEGGLYAGGELSMELPSLEKQMYLYGGVYAKACCWKWCSEWSYGIEFESSDNSDNGLLGWGEIKTSRMRISGNSDLLCLKQFNSRPPSSGGSNDNFTLALAENVVGNAYPKVVLTEQGWGVAVWTDISLVDNNSFQSDIWWSEYTPGVGWSVPQSMNTTSLCELDPCLTLVTDQHGNQRVVMTYLRVDDVVNVNSSIDTFYENNTIGTAVWSSSNGWLFPGGNISVSNGTVNSIGVCDAGNNTVYMVYLFDSNPHPWENGNGSIFLVKGVINNSFVEWQKPLLIKDLASSLNFSCKPSVSFLTPEVGGVVYSVFNESSGLNETILLATFSGLNFTELVIRSTDSSIEHSSCLAFNSSIIVSWIENRSSILSREIAVKESDPSKWTVKNVTEIYSGLSISYIKPIYVDNHIYYLFQAGEKFIPFIVELLSNGSWGDIRQISLEGSYSVGQLDGCCNPDMSQMIYVRDEPVENWMVGHWRFNEGTGNITLDSTGNGNDGYLVGLAEVNSSVYWFRNNGEAGNLSEEYGYGVGFVNETGYVYVPHNSTLDTPDAFTICGWIRLYSYSNGTTVVGKNGSWVIFENNGFLGLKLWRENETLVLSNITTIPLDVWVFIAVIYDNGKVNFSVYPMGYNNVSVEYHLNGVAVNTSVSPVLIGGFNGTVDEVRLFNRAVTGEVVDRIWFAPHATLGSIHDVVVQRFPSFASFEFSVSGLKGEGGNEVITTEDSVKFVGTPPNFDFTWNFGDGTTANGSIVVHRFTSPGFYQVVMKATDPGTGVVTPYLRTLYVWDATPPLFNGLEAAEAGSCCVNLSWNSAVDNSSFVLYYVYMREENEEFNYSKPCLITFDTFCTIHGLKAGVTYYFLVKAKDAAGNIDSNMAVKSATPFDVQPPVFRGVKEAYNISNAPCKVFLSWEKAQDSSPPVVYNIYMSTSSGAYNFSKPYDSTTNEWYVVKGLRNRRYYFVVRAQDTQGNEDDNIVEVNVTPLWESIPPEITVIEASPLLQEAGETVNVSCTVIDNYAVNQVFLNISYPNTYVENISITGGKTGEVYYCNQSYSVTGTYSYFIWANDTCGNSNLSAKHSFVIQDTTPPRVTDVSSYPDPQCEDGYVNISCNVTDNSEVNVVKVNLTYPDGSTLNITMSGGRRYYYNTTYGLLGVYHYFIWVNDTSGNTNVSDVYGFEIIPSDTVPPTTTKTVGEPKYGIDDEWVTPYTEFNLTAVDDFSGVNKTYYRVWHNGTWTPTPGAGVGINNNFMVYRGNFTFFGECKHYLEYYSIDNAGNVEEVHNQTHYVDDTSPISNITISEPKFNWTKHLLTQIIHNIPPEIKDSYNSLPIFITNHSHIRPQAQDQGQCPVGVGEIYYRTWNTFDGWTKWKKYEEKQKPIDAAILGFTLEKQGPHYIEYYSQDLLQNKEKPVHNLSCLVDDTPPETTASGYNPIILQTTERGGKHASKNPMENTLGEFPPVGPFYIHYRYKIGENGVWTNWFTTELQYFTGYITITHNSVLDPIYVDYYATDILGNREEMRHDVFINELKPVSPPAK